MTTEIIAVGKTKLKAKKNWNKSAALQRAMIAFRGARNGTVDYLNRPFWTSSSRMGQWREASVEVWLTE